MVQDVHTGQILALAIRPTFNPNHFRHTTPELLRDHAVSDVYEPGSTFKLVTYSAALDQHVATPDDMIDCQGGQITLAGRVIHDDQGEHFGVIPVHKALEAIQRRRRRQARAQSRPRPLLSVHSRLRLRLALRRRAARRNARPAAPRQALEPLLHRLHRHRPGGRRHSAATGLHGLHHRQRRRLPAAARPHARPDRIPTDTQPKARRTAGAAAPFKPGEDLPNPLPAGAHRVISTLTAAQMRKMMEGVVLFGTGKPAQLNGYSSGGKTGTAQKIDPATHTYSKTMHIASFAGFAPVNNPVIAVAVVLDSPKGAYYGASVSAPVFAEVAQQVLEYLGVPHDIDLRPSHAPPRTTARHRRRRRAERSDIKALYDAANDLPSDDPLRAGSQLRIRGQPASRSLRTKLQRTAASGAATPAQPTAQHQLPRRSRRPRRSSRRRPSPFPTPKHVCVFPSLIGLPVRKVIEQAAAAGLEVEIVGNGTCREQAPAPGTMVPPEPKSSSAADADRFFCQRLGCLSTSRL